MGTIKNQILCEVSGTVGNIVLKKRGEVWYVACRPKKYRKPRDKRSVHNRNQFRLISKLAGIINSIPVIKKLWSQEFPDSYTIFHKILSNNYHSFNCEGLTGTPVLTPRHGFKLNNPDVEINEDELIFKSAPLSFLGINASIEKFITVVSIFMIKSPYYSEYDPSISFRIGIKEPLELENPVQLKTLLKYHNCLLRDFETLYKSWSVLITLDEKDNPVHFSEIITSLPIHNEDYHT